MLAFALGVVLGTAGYFLWRSRAHTPGGTRVAALARGLLPICLVLAVCSALLDLSTIRGVTPLVVMAVAGVDIGFLVLVAASRRPVDEIS
jgi:hypothetical protein